MPDALAVSDLRAGYDRSVVLQGVSLTVPTGRNVAIVGPNGAGSRPSQGDVRNCSSKRRHDPRQRKRRVELELGTNGRQRDHPRSGRTAGFPGLSVAENLWLGGYSKPDRREELLEGVLGTFPAPQGADGERRGFSPGGEQQMLAIGRGLMAEPCGADARRADARSRTRRHRPHDGSADQTSCPVQSVIAGGRTTWS